MEHYHNNLEGVGRAVKVIMVEVFLRTIMVGPHLKVRESRQKIMDEVPWTAREISHQGIIHRKVLLNKAIQIHVEVHQDQILDMVHLARTAMQQNRVSMIEGHTEDQLLL